MVRTATMYEAEFLSVGRGKKTWTARVGELTDAVLVREIRKAGALMSSGVDVDLTGTPDENGVVARGVIYVGGFRPVGEVVIRYATT